MVRIPPEDNATKNDSESQSNKSLGKFSDICGEEEGACLEGLVCAARGRSGLRRCVCPDGWKWTGQKCVAVATESGGVRPNAPCTVGLQDCPENEMCRLGINEKAKRGYCDCMEGMRRDLKTGQCSFKATPAPEAKVTAARKQVAVNISGPANVQLPVDSVSLVATPDSKVGEEEWEYSWSASQDSSGSGAPPPFSHKWNDQILKLTKVKPGNYVFRVTVTGSRYEGAAQFKMSISPERKPNKAPQAVIEPAIVFGEEGKTIILDGSKSLDEDGKIVRYQWSLVSGPAIPDFSQPNTPTLEFKTLRAANYTFSLIVTDDLGAENKTLAKVVVQKERDDPPKAKAGQCGGPEGDFSVTLDSTLDPKKNLEVSICGNASRDDHKITKWMWTRTDKNELTADTQGSGDPVLRVTKMQTGTYQFTLKVEDGKGQSDESSVNVHVHSAANKPPVANAGQNQSIEFPKNEVVLDGSASADDTGIVKYHWELISGPQKVEWANQDALRATASKLVQGLYQFRLNITDDKGLSAISDVFILVKQSDNKPPKAVAAEALVELPATMTTLDGSKSTDDTGIVVWKWSLHEQSSAVLMILGDSASEPVLQLGNLVPGTFKFNLSVSDHEGLSDSTVAQLTIKRGVQQNESVEMYLDKRMGEFSGGLATRLRLRLDSLLNSGLDREVKVQISEVGMEHTSGRVRVVFSCPFVSDSQKALEGSSAVSLIREHLDTLSEFSVHSVDTLYCRNPCSGHGFCDDYSKQCSCERFWMPNLFTVYVLSHPSNCDWSVLYFVLLSVLLVSTVLGTLWAMVCVGRRWCRRPIKRRRRYKLLDDIASNRAINMKKANGRNGMQQSSLLVSDSLESDTDEEDDTLFDASTKKVKT